MTTVAFLGLGHMGGPMAANLLAAGHTVRGFDPVPAAKEVAANKGAQIHWDDATFAEYIKDPKAKVPGTKMVFPGLKEDQKIKDLTAYLHQFDSAPVTLIKE